MELERQIAEAERAYYVACDPIEKWMETDDIDPGACAGIRLYYIVGMPWPEIEKRLTPNNGTGTKPRIKNKTIKALKAAGIM